MHIVFIKNRKEYNIEIKFKLRKEEITVEIKKRVKNWFKLYLWILFLSFKTKLVIKKNINPRSWYKLKLSSEKPLSGPKNFIIEKKKRMKKDVALKDIELKKIIFFDAQNEGK